MAYNPPWRPNFELAALTLWLMVGLLAAVLHPLWPLYQRPFQVLAWLSIPLALRWLPAALHQGQRRTRLIG